MEKKVLIMMYVVSRLILPELTEIFGFLPLEEQLTQLLDLLKILGVLDRGIEKIQTVVSRFRADNLRTKLLEQTPEPDSSSTTIVFQKRVARPCHIIVIVEFGRCGDSK